MVLVGDDEARRAQAVAVERRADLPPVGEGDRRRAVPGLHQRGVVLVEGPALGVHQRIAGPGLRDQHHHRVGQRIAAGQQQLERVVERRRCRSRGRDQRPHLVEVRPQQRRFHRAPAGVHPVDVAALGVDLAVVGDEPVGVRQLPGREGVGGEPLVHQRHRRLRQRIGQVVVEGAHLVGEQQALVDHRAAGERRHVEVGQARAGRTSGPAPPAGSGSACGSPAACARRRPGPCTWAPRAMIAWRITGISASTALPRPGRVDRHVAPADQLLALDADEVLELADRQLARRLVLRHEAHGDAVVAGLRQLQAGLGRPVADRARRGSGSGSRRHRRPADRRPPRRGG